MKRNERQNRDTNEAHACETSIAVAEKSKRIGLSDDASIELAIVDQAFPHMRAWDRRIVLLFDHAGSRFFRVNFHDPANQNYIRRSHFVEVRNGQAQEWPNPAPKHRVDRVSA